VKKLRTGAAISVVLGTVLCFGSLIATAQAASGSSSRSLVVGWNQTEPTLDPDTFEGAPGISVIAATYDGLVNVAPVTGKVVPDLATSWSVSSNGLTYTFNLRKGVKFHDGTAVNAAAVEFSVNRAIKFAGVISSLIPPLSGMSAPNPNTIVFHLKAPDSTFIANLASDDGLRILSPTTIKAHETSSKDDGQTYLENHDAGSGPYEISFDDIEHTLRLTAFPGYWGPKPYYKNITIDMGLSATTMVLELQRGELGAIDGFGLTAQQITSLKNDSNLAHWSGPALYMANANVNPVGLFASAAARRALQSAINTKAVDLGAFGTTGTPSTQFTPLGVLPAGVAVDHPSYNPGPLKALAASAPPSEKSILIGYPQPELTAGIAAQLMQAELQADGFDATSLGMTTAQVVALFEGTSTITVNVLITTENAIGATADSWWDSYFTVHAPTNFFGVGVAQADALVSKATQASSSSIANRDYNEATQLEVNAAYFWPFANLDNVAFSSKGVDVVFKPDLVFTIDMVDTHGS
jgi:peptide/nickel transport system substrate-binding protein